MNYTSAGPSRMSSDRYAATKVQLCSFKGSFVCLWLSLVNSKTLSVFLLFSDLLTNTQSNLIVLSIFCKLLAE